MGFAAVFWLFLPILPAVLLLTLLIQNNVDIPYADQWAVTNTVIKSATQTISWQDLFAQHNESRKVFPRLIYIALAHLTHYNVNYEILVSYLMTCFISITLFILSRKTIQGTFKTHGFLLLLANLLLFTPAQYEAWMIGLSNVVFISIFCLVASISTAYTSLARGLKYGIGMVLAVISTFSFANGMLSWVLTLPGLIFADRTVPLAIRIRRDRGFIFGWLLACGLSLGIYFYQYQKPSAHPSLAEALVKPGDAISYFLAFLGNPFAWGTQLDNPGFAELLGGVLVAVFSLLTLYIIRFWHDRTLRARSIGWLILGIYSMLSAAITTAGRVGFGVDQSLSSRYVTFAIYLPIAIVYLSAIVRQDLDHRRLTPALPLLTQLINQLKQLVMPVLTIFLLLHGLTYAYTAEQMVVMRQERLQMKTCLTLINVVVDSSCLQQLHGGEVNGLRMVANSLNALGWMHPPLMQTNPVELPNANREENLGYGSLDQLTSTRNQDQAIAWALKGWAVLRDRKKLPDAVLITYNAPTQPSLVVKVFPVKEKRLDIAKIFRVPNYRNAGWSGELLLSEIPESAWSSQGTVNLTVWAFDLSQQRAVAIAHQKIERQP